MNKTTKLIAVAIVAAAVGSLSSCGSAPAETMTVGEPVIIDAK
ncbi:hypothetical protein N9192_01275 [Akkermansiaceae bacterium]|nr:hypothetical protein [Akkermansiaceae bacterium]MDB4541505.1 hypothetical protein [Akkermansiaceae bacterium]